MNTLIEDGNELTRMAAFYGAAHHQRLRNTIMQSSRAIAFTYYAPTWAAYEIYAVYALHLHDLADHYHNIGAWGKAVRLRFGDEDQMRAALRALVLTNESDWTFHLARNGRIVNYRED